MIKMNIPMYREFQKKEFGNKNETMSMSQVFSKIRTYEKLVNTDITAYTKEKLNNLKKQIIDLRKELKDYLAKNEIPDNMLERFEDADFIADDKILEIDKKVFK
jgi:uncharacterized protein YlxW (UPF0749 family)